MSEPVTLRLDAATRKRLDRLSKATDRSRAALAAEAVRQFVLLQQVADIMNCRLVVIADPPASLTS